MGLTNDVALNEVQKLFDMCFDANSLCDRIVYVLSIKYNMTNFTEWYHKNIAHKFPELADQIEGFGELRGDLFYRDAVPSHKEDYDSVTQAMENFTVKVAEIEKQCINALKVCAEQNAESYEDFLRDFNMREITPMIKQAVVFYNQIKAYEEESDLHKWNKDYKAWIIPQFGGDDNG